MVADSFRFRIRNCQVFFLQNVNFMEKIIAISVILISLISCDYCTLKTKNISKTSETTDYVVKKYHYDSLTIPMFFKILIRNHAKDFYKIDSVDFIHFCSEYNIDKNYSSNIERYLTISFLHELFTSKTSSNCSKGEILNIPYQWHWVNPNPRHEIYFTSNNVLLKDTKPPPEFSKYNSFADIDRTPYLFLSDLVHSDLKYYSSSCDTFSTFGWCSEREMAFIALTKLLDFEGKVVAEGNHSWSEFVIELKSNMGQLLNFKVTVDNTFDSVDWSLIEEQQISEWKKYYGTTNLSNWYNRKAKSISELRRIENYLVLKESMNRIENKLVKYLELKINKH